MPAIETLWLFAVASAALVAIPGPAVIYIVTRGVAHGRRGAILSMLGIEAGNFVQVLAATAGLAAVVASSAAAFSIVKYAGAAYLVVLGIRALREGGAVLSGVGPARRSDRRLFTEGLLVGTLNPKLAIFLLAFLPQFIDPSAGPVWLQTLVLGSLFNVIAMAGDTLFALASGTAGAGLRARLGRPGTLMRAAGVVYIALGVSAALAEGRSEH
ncbi:MAG TPA: LysE family translocator [Solirubrobacterales bacterium]|nr:LysE family translocator [Solirubrobacterales bacterium]